MHITAVVLTGGAAERMGGVCKPLLIVNGETIWETQCRVLAAVCADLVAAGPAPWPTVRSVADATTGQGPLAGVVAALPHVAAWALVVAGDMPYLQIPVLELLIARARQHVVQQPRCLVVGFAAGDQPQPLCVLIHRKAATIFTERLAAGQRKVAAALTDSRCQAHWIAIEHARNVDPDGRHFTNINTFEDLKK